KITYAKKTQVPKIDQYTKQEEILDGRNSYSKTDHDATFMKMKDDPMKNGQLKPSYNTQVSTENEYAINYSVHQTAGDSTTFKEHYDEIEEGLGKHPEIAVADSGYGSEENYNYLEKNDIENLVKYAGLHSELRTRKKEAFKFTPNSFYINEELNFAVCPMGQKMEFIGIKEQKSTTGFKQEIHRYAARNCKNCPLQPRCFKSKYKDKNKVLSINLKAIRYRRKAKENLTSKDGEELRKRRCAEVEQFFGQMKGNKKFKRFLMKGIDKVNIELGLLFISMNIQKYVRKKVAEAKRALLCESKTLIYSNYGYVA
ncbi:transposase, partial [Flammeovirga sp. OC4]|uniref:transposase n=1 Tax=Flammeovirga sp. OC4 TaxID=1382345 RepID=UPI0012E0A269